MATKEYIYVNSKGEIIKREPKGRGKTKKGAVEKTPGKFFVFVPDDSTPEEAASPSTQPRKQPVYIYLDRDGNEIRREPKGRGKTKAGAWEKEPGSGEWFIEEGYIKPSTQADTARLNRIHREAKEIESPRETTPNPENIVTRHIKSPVKVHPLELCKDFFCSMSDCYLENDIWTLKHVVVQSAKSPLIVSKQEDWKDGIPFNSVLDEVVFDFKRNRLTIVINGRSVVRVYEDALEPIENHPF